jgi:hypothetical protein
VKDGCMGLRGGGGKGRSMWSEETHLPIARVGGNGENLHPLIHRPCGVLMLLLP